MSNPFIASGSKVRAAAPGARRAARQAQRLRRFRTVNALWIAPTLLLYGLTASHPDNAAAQTWNGSVSDLWDVAANWSPGTVPNSSTASVAITSATNNPVLISGINPT